VEREAVAAWISVFAKANQTSVLVALVATACSNDGGGQTTAATTVTVGSTSPTGAETEDPTGGEMTGASGGGSSSSTSSTGNAETSSSGGGPDLGVCDVYINCMMELHPETIATTIATYGSEGSCWSLPGVTEEDCWTECEAQRMEMVESHPDVTSCWACDNDADCPAATRCELFEHRCRPPDEIAHCDFVMSYGGCREGPVASFGSCTNQPGFDHCPPDALGYCWSRYDEEVTKFYPTGKIPYTAATAEMTCEPDPREYRYWFPL